jgi:hypothetical protein
VFMVGSLLLISLLFCAVFMVGFLLLISLGICVGSHHKHNTKN